MKNKTWLVLDCPNLCHRAFYTTGSLSYNGDATGVTYGFLVSLLSLMEEHATQDVIFCFDYGRGLREKQCSEYKSARRQKERERPDDEKEARRGLRREIRRLRDEILPELGYRNIFYQKGYEADDLIARVCLMLSPPDEMVIVSSDKDLYQLISKDVSIWNPIKKTTITLNAFTILYGISPVLWSTVKAIAGCESDGVQGIKGIGEKTAAKFLLGQLKETSKAHQSIANNEEIWRRNLSLVKLPYKGTKIPKIRKDWTTHDKWKKVLKSLGMTSLLKRV